MAVVMLLGVVARAAPDELRLEVGGQLVKDGVLVSVDRPATVEAMTIGERQVLLSGKAPGSATVAIATPGGEKSWRVTVVPFDPVRAAAELRALMPKVDDLTVGFEGHCAWLECPDCTDAQRTQADAVLVLRTCVTSVDRVTPPRDPGEVLAGARKLLGEGPEDTKALVLEVRGGRVVLRGHARTAADAQRVAKVRAAFPEVTVHVVGP
jgi:Flp pilus assembly secretin CpaC